MQSTDPSMAIGRRRRTGGDAPTLADGRSHRHSSSSGCWFVPQNENVSHAAVPWSFPHNWSSPIARDNAAAAPGPSPPQLTVDEVSQELFRQTVNRKRTASVDLRWSSETSPSFPAPPLWHFFSACLLEQGAPPVVAEAISTRTATLRKLVPDVRAAWTAAEGVHHWALAVLAVNTDALHAHVAELLLPPSTAATDAKKGLAAPAEDGMLLVLLDLFGGDSSAVEAAALCTQIAKGIVLVSLVCGDVARALGAAFIDDLDVALHVASALDVPFAAVQLLLEWWKRATTASTRNGWLNYSWLSWLVLVEHFANFFAEDLLHAVKEEEPPEVRNGGRAAATRLTRCVCFGPEGLTPVAAQRSALQEGGEEALLSVLRAWGDVLQNSSRAVWWEALTRWDSQVKCDPVKAAALFRGCVDCRGPWLPFEQVIVCVPSLEAFGSELDGVSLSRTISHGAAVDRRALGRRGEETQRMTTATELDAHRRVEARESVEESTTPAPPWRVWLTPASAIRRLSSALPLLARFPQYSYRRTGAATVLDDDETLQGTTSPQSLTASTIWRHRSACTLANHVKLLLIRVGWFFADGGSLAEATNIAKDQQAQLRSAAEHGDFGARCVEAILVASSGLLCVIDAEAFGWLCVVERAARALVHAQGVQAFARAWLSAHSCALRASRHRMRSVVTVQAFARSRDSMRRTMLKDCLRAIASACPTREDDDVIGDGRSELLPRAQSSQAWSCASVRSALPVSRGEYSHDRNGFVHGIRLHTTSGSQQRIAAAQDQLCRLEQRYRAWVAADEQQTRRNRVDYVFQIQFPIAAFLAHEHEQRQTVEQENVLARGTINSLQETSLRERVCSLERRARWRFEVVTAGVRLPVLIANESRLRSVLEGNALAGIKELRDMLEVASEVLHLRRNMGPQSSSGSGGAGARRDSLSRLSSTTNIWPLSLMTNDTNVGHGPAAVVAASNADGDNIASAAAIAFWGARGAVSSETLGVLAPAAVRASYSRPIAPLSSNSAMLELAGSSASPSSSSALTKPLHEMQQERLVETFLAEMASIVMAEREERAKITTGTAAALFACREVAERHGVLRQWLFSLSRLRCAMQRDRLEVVERVNRAFLWATQSLLAREVEKRLRGVAWKEEEMRVMLQSVARSERTHLQSTAALWESVCRDEYTSPAALLSKLERERNAVQRCLATLAADDRAQRKALRDRLRHTTSDARTLSPSTQQSMRGPRR